MAAAAAAGDAVGARRKRAGFLDFGELTVHVRRATGLAVKDLFSSDPYCVISVGGQEKRTAVHNSTLNPVFDESFTFPVTGRDCLHVLMWDSDFGRRDDFMGELLLPVDQIAEGASEQWHTLQPQPGSKETVSGELLLGLVLSGSGHMRKRQAAGGAGAAGAAAGAAADAGGASAEERQELPEQFVIDPAQLDIQAEAIGEGAFGTVHRARFRGLDVAVKQLRMARVSDAVLRDYAHEVAALAGVAHHPHLVLFLGATSHPPLVIVTELLGGGTLADRIYDAEDALPWPRRVAAALDTALGMAFLHGAGVFHRDIKAENLLLDEHGRVKLADFGMCRTRTQLQKARTVCGTEGWIAPEVYEEGAEGYTAKVDVYSFGCVLFELAARKMPYDGMPPAQMMRVTLEGKTPDHFQPLPDDTPPAFARLMRRCLDRKPQRRPGFEEVVEELRGVQSSLG